VAIAIAKLEHRVGARRAAGHDRCAEDQVDAGVDPIGGQRAAI
jgi:hypothetical protein